MNRDDIIQSREDVIANVRTLYSYLNGIDGEECQQWAIERMRLGRNFVVEIIDGKICFGPSRFVGYLQNSFIKHEEHPGNGRQTDDQLKKFYTIESVEKLDHLFQETVAIYGISTTAKKYWVPNDDPQIESLLSLPEHELLGNIKIRLFNNASSYISKAAQLLKTKRNIIIQGAPGTGKTYNTAAIALSVLGQTGLDLSNHKAVMERYQELCDKDQIFFTTFHQSLDYEDFVEGLKPRVQTDANGNSIGVTYEPVDGIFKRACNAVRTKENVDIVECIDNYLDLIKSKKNENRRLIPTKSRNSSLYVWWKEGNTTISTRSKNSECKKGEDYSPSPLNIEKIKLQAQGLGVENNWKQYAEAFIDAVKAEYNVNEDKPVVLIIDEINRGNVSKIFGELITLLEADKRDPGEHTIPVTLPYTQMPFTVPANLYIIGTMNTTDRSTGSIDYALRRRFAFVTLKSDVEVVEQHYEAKGNLALKQTATDLFNDIKSFIENPQHLCSDLGIDDLMVGHSYFMADNEDELRNKVEYEIIPLISEYINDGILNVSAEEKKEAFEAWMTLQVFEDIDETLPEEEE